MAPSAAAGHRRIDQDLSKYYSNTGFTNDFVAFIQEWCATVKPPVSAALRALVEYRTRCRERPRLRGACAGGCGNAPLIERKPG